MEDPVATVLLGALHDVTGAWTWPVTVLLAALVPMTRFGWIAGRDMVLEERVLSAGSPEAARTPAASGGPAAPAVR